MFFDKGAWYALLASPPYVNGHTILSLKASGSRCPRSLTGSHLSGVDCALADVVQAIADHYRPKDVLIVSLRGRDPHIHFHLIPLWQETESAWREESHHDRGHLFEFLGHVEITAQAEAMQQRIKNGWTEEDQRKILAEAMHADVQALRLITAFPRGPTPTAR